MPKPKAGTDSTALVPVRSLRKRNGRRKASARAEPEHRGGLLQQPELRSPPAITPTQLKLLAALTFHLLRETCGDDVKILALASTLRDVPDASKKEKDWLVSLVSCPQSIWPEGF